MRVAGHLSIQQDKNKEKPKATGEGRGPGDRDRELMEWGLVYGGEFDPGSGSTLAACLMHASRTGCFRALTWRTGEEHVGNLS